MGIPFDYKLTTDLPVGESVKVQDPVQTILAVSMDNGIKFTRSALHYPFEIPSFRSYKIWNVGTVAPTSMEYSKDGNVLYVSGDNGTVVKISGFNDWYGDDDPTTVLTKTTIFSNRAPVSGMSLHPTDESKLLVTLGRYGSPSHVYELNDVDKATGVTGFTDINGDLPDFPVYDAEYNLNNPSQVLIGTELGLWATEDIYSGAVTWTNQSGAMGNVPVLDVRQQRLPFGEASNYGRFYIGTFGRGIWSSGDLVSVNDKWENFESEQPLSSLEMYPNPVSTNATLSFDMNVSGEARIVIYSITGQLISSEVKRFSVGKAKYSVNSTNMSAGTYFAIVSAGDVQEQTKFVVVK